MVFVIVQSVVRAGFGAPRGGALSPPSSSAQIHPLYIFLCVNGNNLFFHKFQVLALDDGGESVPSRGAPDSAERTQA